MADDDSPPTRRQHHLRAKENDIGHWYTETGEPRHWQDDGKATTLRHARKQNLFPSVTTVLDVAAKPALTYWLQEHAVLQTLEDGYDYNHYLEQMEGTRSEYARFIINAAKEKTLAKADEGTDIHALVEAWYTNKDVDDKHLRMCEAVSDVVCDNTKCLHGDWFSEIRFCDTKLGYAGMCDLHNDEWVIDFKTKDHVDEKTRGWPEQAMQLAAYAHGLGIPNARLANVFISRADYTVRFYEHKDPLAFEKFRAILTFWQLSKKYGPIYEAMK